MRTLAIGDVHGCLKALDTLLDAIQLTADDLLITLGDYIDRGPDSAGVIDRILELHRTHRVVSLRGNHEVMMEMARASTQSAPYWMKYGGRETMQSYPQPTFDAVPDAHWHFMDKVCKSHFETDRHIFVHADIDRMCAMDSQTEEWTCWHKLDADSTVPHFSGKVVVCGHTEQRSGIPLNLGHTICIDTWAYRDGWLTCLDVLTGNYWQANQRGVVRQDRLVPPDLNDG